MKRCINVPPAVNTLLELEENASHSLWNAYLKVRELRLVTRSEIVGTTEISRTFVADLNGIEITQE